MATAHASTTAGKSALDRKAKTGRPLRTLAIDIGASGIKMAVLNEMGEPQTDRVRIKTPDPAVPDAIVSAVVTEAESQQAYDRVSVGFPGVVRDGVVKNAPNLAREWKDFNLRRALEEKLGHPVRVSNDADMQGLGAITGTGVELVLTLGTGVGSALFLDGMLVPNVEVGYDKLSNAALEAVGKKKWNKRLLKAIAKLERLFNYDRLYLGGGNSRYVKVDKLPANVTVVSNLNGLVGGVELWRDGPENGRPS
jgi:polyphosphate glucokinase